jgi:cellobiose dehydrogenase-like cytochrome
MKTAIASVLLGLGMMPQIATAFFRILTFPGSSAYAAIDQSCPKSGVCYEVNVPDSTASSGSGDIFFQITGPSSYAWIGMGTGSQMSGSNMFIIYQSGDGTNVTLSPRKGSGHNMPNFDSSAQVFLMEGSGVNGDKMTANIRCEKDPAIYAILLLIAC